MKSNSAAVLVFLCAVMSAAGPGMLPAASALPARGGQAQTSPSPVARRIGAIKAINGSVITLRPDSGAEVAVAVQTATRIVRIPPGEKNLQNASPIQVQDLQVGDRILVGGRASEDGSSLAAASIVVMKRSDVEARQELERLDWQKRGLGGLVSALDPSTGTVTISVAGFAGTRSVAVHTSKATVFRRYAPDSVKFEDAKPSTLEAVQAGDQLRVRGNRSADGTEFSAEEIVTGSFRNIAGTVNSVDAGAGTISVQDLMSKKAVQVKVTAESQLHKLPVELAQRIAMRLKGATRAGTPGATANPSSSSPAPRAAGGQGGPPGGAGPGGEMAGPAAMGGMRSGGAPDFQQMLGRMPAIALADLHKGDAVMLVATQGTAPNASTAITLLSGVEPILEAAPNANQAMMLAPWSLGSAPNGDAANP